MAPLTALAGTPYLLGDELGAPERAVKSLEKAHRLRDQAISAQWRLEREAHELLGPFDVALRSELVAESNQIEGIEWPLAEVRTLINQYRYELQSPRRPFLEAVRSDEHAYEVIGLYAAHQLAEQLAKARGPMREVDIRQLHSVVTGVANYAGRYKRAENSIGGTALRRTAPWDVPRAMNELCDWWANTDTDPILQAAIVHAWLSDIHPFDDGNGRVSRILANYCLVKANYPPLILRSQSDRGQYYDALAESDAGNILPLLELFVVTLRRTVKIMRSPNYTQQVIDGRLLSNVRDRYSIWSATLATLKLTLEQSLAAQGVSHSFQGSPTIEGFSLLENLDSDGNCWFMKFGHDFGWSLLAWFGFPSERMRDLTHDGPFPSIFFSTRTRDARAPHPYERIGEREYFDLPNEIRLRPGSSEPLQFRYGYEFQGFRMDVGIDMLTRSICRSIGFQP